MTVLPWKDLMYKVGHAYSPILATAAFVVSVFTYLRDDRKLHLSLVLTYFVKEVGINDPDGSLRLIHGLPLVKVTVDSSVNGIMHELPTGLQEIQCGTITLKIACTNSGRRPIAIRRWGVVYNERTPKKHWRMDNGLLIDLDPHPNLAESATYTISVDDLRQFGLDVFNFRGAFLLVEDTQGKRWKLPEAQFVYLRKALNGYRFALKMDIAVDESGLPEKDEASLDYQAGFEVGSTRGRLPPLATRMWQRGYSDALHSQGLDPYRKDPADLSKIRDLGSRRDI